MPIITLTTDFGAADWFAGTMRGVILSLTPQAKIVDLTHGIPAGDTRAGAFALAASFRFFPRRTVHVAVIDPGVGSHRRAIAVQTTDYIFVGPDNGLLSWALRGQTIKTIHSLENESYFLRPVSRTFQGRDIFAPVAAHLARGVPIARFGPKLSQIVRLTWPGIVRTTRRVCGKVLYIDRFGNAITNIAAAPLSALGTRRLEVAWGRKRSQRCSLAEFYQTAPKGQPVAVLGSSGFLELAVNGGSAAELLALQVGTSVRVFVEE